MVLDYWSLDARLKAWQLWVLALLLGLVGTSTGLWPQRLEVIGSETELSHLVMDETSPYPSFVYTPINLATIPQILCMIP